MQTANISTAQTQTENPFQFSANESGVPSRSAKFLEAIQQNHAPHIINLLAQYGFEEPVVTKATSASYLPLFGVNATQGLRTIPSITTVFLVEDAYLPGDSQPPHQHLQSLDNSEDAECFKTLIRDTTNRIIAGPLDSVGLGSRHSVGLERALVRIHHIQRAKEQLARLPLSETNARAQLGIRLAVLQEQIDNLRNSQRRTGRYPVYLTVCGDPQNPQHQKQLIHCGSLWQQGLGLPAAKAPLYLENSPHFTSLTSAVQAQTRASFAQYAPPVFQESYTGFAQCNQHAVYNLVQDSPLARIVPAYPLCPHLAAVADHLGVDGINATYAELQAAYRSLWV